MDITPECRAVANYIIEETNKYNQDKPLREQVMMTTKRLQKLLYFCDIEYMKKYNGRTLFIDDFKAWASGPVIPEVYYQFIQYQDGPMIPKYDDSPPELTDEIKSIIDEVLETTKDLDTIDLANISKVIDGPWHRTFKEKYKDNIEIISKEEMYNFYLNKNIFNQNKSKKKSKKISLFRNFI